MQTTKPYPCVVTIATSDSSGGAGVQADIKAISATGSYAASVIAALTAQNTQAVNAIQEIPSEFVQQQINSVFTDLNVNAVKIGVLYNKKNIDIVASTLNKFKPPHIVLDPVMISKSGCELLPEDTVYYLKEKLFSHTTLITPNLPEAEKLLDQKITHLSAMESAAITLGQQFQTNVLVKGGHLNLRQSSDVLYLHRERSCRWFENERIDTKNTHGTGCTLSAAIASYLAQEYSLNEAVYLAKQYLMNAIQSGSHYRLGQGCGPVNHFYHLRKVGL